MGKRVFVLGAGASKSYGESPTKQRMPIACDFFPTFEKLEISSNPWVLQEGLFTYLLNKGISDPKKYLDSGVDIEELHSEIETFFKEALREKDTLKRILYQRPYLELLFIFAACINAIQNGPPSKSHAKLSRLVTPDDTIITFNWDTLMDRALSLETNWRPDFGYNIVPKNIFRDGWINPSPFDGTRFTKLLKLHGSSNWLTSHLIYQDGDLVLSQQDPPEVFTVFEYATKPYATHQGRFMEGYQPYSYGYYPPNLTDIEGRSAKAGYLFIKMTPKMPWKPDGEGGQEGLISMPLIIPPVKEKSYGLFGGLFSKLWLEAEKELSEADHIVIIGYSFPKTDIKSRDLFLKAFMNKKIIPKVTIIDPCPENIVDRFVFEFGIPISNINCQRDYFSEDYAIEKVI